MESNLLKHNSVVSFANTTIVILYSIGACVGICGCCAYAYYRNRDNVNHTDTPIVYVSGEPVVAKYTTVETACKPRNGADAIV